MNIQTLQDALIALTTLVGVAVVFAIAIVVASGLVRRDKARNRQAVTAVAQHPTQSDRVRELVSR